MIFEFFFQSPNTPLFGVQNPWCVKPVYKSVASYKYLLRWLVIEYLYREMGWDWKELPFMHTKNVANWYKSRLHDIVFIVDKGKSRCKKR